MAVSVQNEPDLQLADNLLQIADPEERVRFLQKEALFNHDGLSQLLDQAMILARTDPGQAHQLTTVCSDLAILADAPSIIPRAIYIRAQTHAINGEFQQAYELITLARDHYHALGETLPALRTNVGLMHVLNELGRHQEAVDLGKASIESLLYENDTDNPEAQLIAALINHNLGVCYRLMGQYKQALEVYDVAKTYYQATGLTERIGDIYNNQGIILLHLGRVREALATFEEAAEILQAAGRTLLYAQCLINMGDAYLQLGNYTLSLEVLDEARTRFLSLDALAQEQVLLLHRANVYLALNLYPEAIEAYREAHEQCLASGMVHYQAQALWGLGVSLAATNQLEEAEHMLASAAALFAAANNVPLLCSVKLEQAALQNRRGDKMTAWSTAEEALALVQGDRWPVQQLYAHLRLADISWPDTAVVESHLLAAQTMADTLFLPQIRYRLYRRLGVLRWQQGDDKEGQQWLETAVAEIENLRGNVAQEAMRISFLADKLTAYNDLIRLYLSKTNYSHCQQAFITAERAKSRALVELLTGVWQKSSQGMSDSDNAIQLQALRTDLNVVYNALLGSGKEEDNRLPQLLLERAKAIETQINQLQQPLLASATDSQSAPHVDNKLLEKVPPDVTVLAYHILDDELVGFIYNQGEMQVVPELCSVTAVHKELQYLSIQWDRFRAGSSFVNRHISRLELTTQRILNNLYQLLVSRLRQHLPQPDSSQPKKLLVIPHGLIHQVPFHALYDGQAYLIDHYEISYVPSLTVFNLCQEKRCSPQSRSVVFGSPDPRIPAVRLEAARIAAQLPKAALFLDKDASQDNLLSISGNVSTLHLACHGLFRADNPMFSALRFHDGWLTAVDIMKLDLPGALVVLSACESGRHQISGGDEILGLTRAFLGAGAASLIISLWLVQDESTAVLMTDWYARMQADQTMGLASALRAAQLGLKESHPHPYYWAPFLLVGQR